MKKFLVALCALATMAMVGCKKETVTPSPSPNPNPDNPAPQLDTREGAYDPVCKIVGITYSDNSAPEIWIWDSETGRLVTVNDDDNCGGYTERIRFAYLSDGRVDNVTMQNIDLGGVLPVDNLSGTMAVGYNGDYISSLSLVNNGSAVLTMQVQHNGGNKIGGATIDLSDNVLLDVFNTVLAQFLADSTGTDNFVTSIDNVAGNVAFTWDGDNVSEALLNIGFRVATTIGTLVNVIGEDNLSMFSNYGSTLATLASMFPNQPVYFNVTLGDTVDYTYDDKVNPFLNYLGRIDISALSANNVLTEQHAGNAHVAITTKLGSTDMQIFATDYPLPLGATTYEYQQYNAAGCPLRMVDGEGLVTEYQYKEE